MQVWVLQSTVVHCQAQKGDGEQETQQSEMQSL